MNAKRRKPKLGDAARRELRILTDLHFELGEHIREFRKALEEESVSPTTYILDWDPMKSVLEYGYKKVRIPPASHQSCVCDELFLLAPGEWLQEERVRSDFTGDTKDAFYSAVRALNKAAERGLGLKKKAFEYRRNMVRIWVENFTQKK